jgi:alkanesulfonate monooxygenase SsuD/methylene tetrahydromethanopterin reductase-like flavin-dependent oxidoreductase (luciferase family)
MLNRLALVADGWVASGHYTADQFLAGITTIRDRARAGGRDPDRLGYTKVQGISVHRDANVARERARRHWQRYYGPSFDVDHAVIHGTPDRCAAQLARFRAANARTLTLILEPTSLDGAELDLLWSTTQQALRTAPADRGREA